MAEEYIEKEAAINAIEDTSCYLCKKYIGTKKCDCDCEIWRNKKMLHIIPAADVKPVVRGKWIDKGESPFCGSEGRMYFNHEYECNHCGFTVRGGELKYCPNCGAVMEGKRDV